MTYYVHDPEHVQWLSMEQRSKDEWNRLMDRPIQPKVPQSIKPVVGKHRGIWCVKHIPFGASSTQCTAALEIATRNRLVNHQCLFMDLKA